MGVADGDGVESYAPRATRDYLIVYTGRTRRARRDGSHRPSASRSTSNTAGSRLQALGSGSGSPQRHASQARRWMASRTRLPGLRPACRRFAPCEGTKEVGPPTPRSWGRIHEGQAGRASPSRRRRAVWPCRRVAVWPCRRRVAVSYRRVAMSCRVAVAVSPSPCRRVAAAAQRASMTSGARRRRARHALCGPVLFVADGLAAETSPCDGRFVVLGLLHNPKWPGARRTIALR